MIASALTVLLILTGAIDSLSAVTLQKLSFKAPKEWSSQSDDPSTREWASPDEGARLAVSVFAVDPQRPAASCLDQMVEKVGGEGFERIRLGGQNAARRSAADVLGGGDAGNRDDNRVTTTTVLGCNGRVRWLLTFSAKTSQGARFGAMLKRILESISYGK